MEKDPNSQPNQPSEGSKKGSDLPGTSKDPTGRVISDKSQGKNRQDQDSDRNRSGYRDPNSDSQKRS